MGMAKHLEAPIHTVKIKANLAEDLTVLEDSVDELSYDFHKR